MISMSMGVEHRIQRADVLANRLLAKVRSGIDYYGAAAVFNEYRRARSFIARVRRMTNQAIASDRGHAHRRSAAQYGQRRLHFAAGTCCAFLAMAFVTSTYAIRVS